MDNVYIIKPTLIIQNSQEGKQIIYRLEQQPTKELFIPQIGMNWQVGGSSLKILIEEVIYIGNNTFIIRQVMSNKYRRVENILNKINTYDGWKITVNGELLANNWKI
ncbi:MAG: hypothetical protein ACOCP8_00330 [archaeon]